VRNELACQLLAELIVLLDLVDVQSARALDVDLDADNAPGICTLCALSLVGAGSRFLLVRALAVLLELLLGGSDLPELLIAQGLVGAAQALNALRQLVVTGDLLLQGLQVLPCALCLFAGEVEGHAVQTEDVLRGVREFT
jgi:hypothetical protein